MKFVAAALGNNVEDAAGRFTIFSTVRAGFDLDLLNKLERKICARTAKSRVGGIYAVEDVVILRSG